MKFEYVLTLLVLYLIALFIKTRYKIKVFSSIKESLIFYLIIFTFGSIWDNFAVWRGHWSYLGNGILGIFVGLVPIEDYIFAAVTSYIVLILHQALPKIFKNIKNI